MCKIISLASSKSNNDGKKERGHGGGGGINQENHPTVLKVDTENNSVQKKL